MYNDFDNNNNERPRFDPQTGLPITYEETPSQNNEEHPSEVYAGQVSEQAANENAATDDRNAMFFTTEELNNLSQKPSKKETKKAAKNANGKSSKKIVKMVAASIMCGVIAGSTMYGVFRVEDYYYPVSTSKTSNVNIATVSAAGTSGTTSNLVSDGTTSSLDVPGVVKAAMPAVVAITGTVTTTQSNFGFFSGGTSEASTSGTGIIIGKNDTELLMVTNAHVVDGVNNLKVTFNDNEAVSASVKGTKSDKDIAVVAVKISDIKESTINNIAIASLGDSENIQVGESVVAIGNALGEGQSVTVGWVSALNRSITVENTQYSGLIMTDAAINPGNSGGALLNAKGEVVGINSAKYSSEEVEGMGYAIPISSVKDIIDNLVTKQTRSKVADSEKSYLGIAGSDVTADNAATFNVPKGIMVSQVVSGSPAEKAGLAKNDIIVSFDGDDVTAFTELQSTMQYYAAGTKVTVGYYHFNNDSKKYELNQVEVTLGNANSK